MWCKKLLFLSLLSFASGIDVILPGPCPKMYKQDEWDYSQFFGEWYNVATYASGGDREMYDCASFDFMKLDMKYNIGFMLTEKYIHVRNGSSLWLTDTHLNRLAEMFDGLKPGRAFHVGYGNKYLQLSEYPFLVFVSDYDRYGIAYTCRIGVKSIYVFCWTLIGTKEKLDGFSSLLIDNAVHKYLEEYKNRPSFVFKDFSEESNSVTVDVKAKYTSIFC